MLIRSLSLHGAGRKLPLNRAKFAPLVKLCRCLDRRGKNHEKFEIFVMSWKIIRSQSGARLGRARFCQTRVWRNCAVSVAKLQGCNKLYVADWDVECFMMWRDSIERSDPLKSRNLIRPSVRKVIRVLLLYTSRTPAGSARHASRIESLLRSMTCWRARAMPKAAR
jgi:hypothetical protein